MTDWPAIVSSFAAPPDEFFDSNGVQIRYLEAGTGQPVVLIHGLTSSAEHGWIDSGAFQRLANNYRVIALDCRGHGKSGKPHDSGQYGREMAEDVIRLLDHLGIPTAHIAGYSMGGAITAWLLAARPERFITAILAGAAPRTERSPEGDCLRETWAAEIERGSLRSIALAVWPTDQPKPSEEQIREFSADRLAGNDPRALAAAVRGPALTVDKAALASVRVPVLGVAGTADPSLNALNALKPLMPALTVVPIEGAGHLAFSRSEFVQAIENFLAAHPIASR